MHVFAAGVAALLAGSVAEAAFPVQTYQSQPFTAPAFKVHRAGKTEPGSLFLGYFKTEGEKDSAPMIFEDSGDLVWHGHTGAPAYNFHKQVLDGKPVLTYWTGFLDYQGHGFGNVKILNQNYKEIYNLCFPDSLNSKIYNPRQKEYPGNTKNPCYIDKHESLITDQGTILLTAYNATQADLRKVGGDKNGWVWDCLVVEMDVKTQKILFQWSALDHVKITDSHFVNTTGPNPLHLNDHVYGTENQPWDFFHINSIQKAAGGYILNSRMTWAFYMIARSGQKIWTLEGSQGGDFKLAPGIFWSWQHMPRINVDTSTDSKLEISLFNNDNIPGLADGKNTSSGYYLEVNLLSKKVKALKDLRPKKPLYGVAEGAYQVLNNDHSLVGYGSVPFLEEYAGTKRVYSAQFGALYGKPHSYRAYRYPWASKGQGLPRVAAKGAAGKGVAYMSWNGATHYDSWNVYAGKTKGKLSVVARGVAKKGFETAKKFALQGNKFVQVEALAGKQSLGKSRVVPIA